MKADDLLDLIGDVDDSIIQEAKAKKKAAPPHWVKWAAAAACFCLVVGTAVTVSTRQTGNHVQKWNAGFSAEQYFKYAEESGAETASAIADSAIPYAESRHFSDDRELFESESVIPVMEDHPIFTAIANYNEDGSLYCVELLWQRRDAEGMEHYSDLSVTAGTEEIPRIEDEIAIEIDDNGNVIEPGVTVTERDGVQIVAVGNEDQDKTITFQNDSGWYQISGSWNDSYEDMAELLDWFWAHPIDFSLFS